MEEADNPFAQSAPSLGHQAVMYQSMQGHGHGHGHGHGQGHQPMHQHLPPQQQQTNPFGPMGGVQNQHLFQWGQPAMQQQQQQQQPTSGAMVPAAPSAQPQFALGPKPAPAPTASGNPFDPFAPSPPQPQAQPQPQPQPQRAPPPPDGVNPFAPFQSGQTLPLQAEGAAQANPFAPTASSHPPPMPCASLFLPGGGSIYNQAGGVAVPPGTYEIVPQYMQNPPPGQQLGQAYPAATAGQYGQLVASSHQSNPYVIPGQPHPQPQQQPQQQQQQPQQQQQQQQQQQLAIIQDNDDDFFGEFSANKPKPSPAGGTNSGPDFPLSEIDTADATGDAVSVVSGSHTAGANVGGAPDSSLSFRRSRSPPSPSGRRGGGNANEREYENYGNAGDDHDHDHNRNSRAIVPVAGPNRKAITTFAPPPEPTRAHAIGREIASRTHLPDASGLPDPRAVRHAGYVLSRISFRTILIKKWKQTYWVQYGPNSILFFRSESDFGDWMNNPYLTLGQREFLLKLKVDFVGDLTKANVRGYQVTQVRLKAYKNKMMHQFKLERWMDYGPTIAAAYASADLKEVRDLRRAMVDIMKNCPQDPALAGIGQRQFVDSGPPPHGGPHRYPPNSVQNGNGHPEYGRNNYGGGGGGADHHHHHHHRHGDDGYHYGGASSERRSQSVPEIGHDGLHGGEGGQQRRASEGASTGALDEHDSISVITGVISEGGGVPQGQHLRPAERFDRRTQSMGAVENDYLGVSGSSASDPYGMDPRSQAMHHSAR